MVTIIKTVELKNGRKYQVADTHAPYVDGEYPTGGFVIHTWLGSDWSFVSRAADAQGVEDFLRLAARLKPIECLGLSPV